MTNSFGAGAAVLGLALGAVVAAHGPFLAVDRQLSTVATALSPSVDTALARWALIASVVGLIAFGLIRRAPVARGTAWAWPVTGLALGGVGVLAWLMGAPAGWRWGLSITGPSRSLIESVVLGVPVGWGTALVVGIPLGSWLSARARGPVTWRAPGGSEIARRFGGGLLMGVGGTLAAGCNIGNALTGLSVLAVNSVIATAAIVGGAAMAIVWPGILRRILGLHVTRGQR